MKDKIIKILRNLFLDQADCLINRAAKEISSLLKGEGEYYQKVYIKSDTDLPKDGLYIAHYKMYKTDSPAGTILSQYDHLNSHKKQNWLERIDWYLQPVSLPDKELTVEIIKYNATSYADEKKALIPNFTDYEWSQSFIDYSRGFCDGFGMTMNNNIPDKDAIIEKLNELNKLRKSYIVFLGEQLSDNAAFLKAHGIVCSETDFKIGAEYRKQIEHFELELANLKKQ